MRPMGTLDDEYVEKILSGNTHHLVMLMDILFRKNYIQPKSRIINISSVSGRKIPFAAMYLVGATKATMEALTRTWAELLGAHPNTAGTTVNALLVGATATDALLENAPLELTERAATVLKTGEPILGPMGMGRPEDVADVAGLIASEKARWITGGVVCANGGYFSII
ncbi:short-chain dehydrogenase [Pochonia chlamydosporia 170]|uniref:Short-chain dehydrogenase n=1 Tax=Pochonia chlamydosporia 170 TaxID=1380566 RepID=A0A179FBS6_METCM|nr:short-chain dehydrogenase [Pochonia chlamydosporia 170]OAQ62731.1 short-chain dehydrogenase [Pochonia chlamydosporia 170]